jgi:hypothetical protein
MTDKPSDEQLVRHAKALFETMMAAARDNVLSVKLEGASEPDRYMVLILAYACGWGVCSEAIGTMPNAERQRLMVLALEMRHAGALQSVALEVEP